MIEQKSISLPVIDPVCGMNVIRRRSRKTEVSGRELLFLQSRLRSEIPGQSRSLSEAEGTHSSRRRTG
jgi:YHS domain-containing protein